MYSSFRSRHTSLDSQVDYHASGSSEAAARIAEALTAGGFDWDFDGVRGYDFGCWSPLALIFPDASVPVVQVCSPL